MIYFPDYTAQQLLSIFDGCTETDVRRVEDEARRRVSLLLEYMRDMRNFGNADSVKRLFADMRDCLLALVENTGDDRYTFTAY